MIATNVPSLYRRYLVTLLIVAATRVAAQFNVSTDKDVGYPQVTKHHFFEKIDALDQKPWRYTRVDNFEVLSRCSEEATNRFVGELGRRLQLMKSFLPAESAAYLDAPINFFFYREDNTAQVKKQREAKVSAYPFVIPTNIDRTDRKAPRLVMVNLWPFENSAKGKEADDALRFAAATVVHEITTLQLRSEKEGWKWNVSNGWLWSGLQHFCVDLQLSSNSITFAWPPFVYSPELRGYPKGGIPPKTDLLPMEFLFSEPPSIRNNLYSDGIREIQSGLFIRWALLGDRQRHREAFWKFAARARTEAIAEALFQQYFGMNYAQVRTELMDYLEKDRPSIPLPTLTRSAIVAPRLPKSRGGSPAEIERFKEAVNQLYDESQPRA